MKYKSKSGKKQIFAAIITFAVIALLVFAGPASAINLGLNAFSNSNPIKGEIISTTATITLNSNERMSMPNPAGVFIDGVQKCAFALNSGQTCSSSGITITLLSTSDANGYGYDYNYGYDYGYNYGYANGYGYGYGYQQGYSNSKFTYNITINTSYYSMGEHKIKLSVNVKPDPASQIYSSGEQTVTIGVSEEQQYADSPTETVGENVTEIVFDSGSSSVNKIVIPSTVEANKSITLDMSSLLSGNTINVSNGITLERNSGNNYTAVIPAGTVITGPAGWDGKITLPTVKAVSGYSISSGSIDAVIDLGSVSELNFSNPVEVVLGGMAGKKAGWTHGTTLTSIDTTCNNLTAPTNINSASPRECSIDSGSDLAIWTYHFTSFGAYTPAVASTTVAVSSSGGSGWAVNKTVNATTPSTNTGTDNNSPSDASAKQGLLSRITGAFIGTFGPVGSTIIVVFIIAVIAGLVVMSVRRKRK